MAERASDWKDTANVAPSNLPETGELTYPEPAAIEPQPPLLPGMTEDEEGSFAPHSRLNTAAEKIGGVIGTAHGKVKSRLHVVGGRSVTARDARDWADEAGERVSEIKDVASEKLQEAKEVAAERLSDLRQTAKERISDWSVIARQRIALARRRAAFYANEYPVQTILALAGTAFCVGFILRMWRSNSD